MVNKSIIAIAIESAYGCRCHQRFIAAATPIYGTARPTRYIIKGRKPGLTSAPFIYFSNAGVGGWQEFMRRPSTVDEFRQQYMLHQDEWTWEE